MKFGHTVISKEAHNNLIKLENSDLSQVKLGMRLQISMRAISMIVLW
jgi:hypothetical protein